MVDQFLCELQKREVMPKRYNVSQRIQYIFCDDVDRLESQSNEMQEFVNYAEEVKSMVSVVLEKYNRLLSAMVELKDLSEKLATCFTAAKQNKNVSFSLKECKLAFLLSVIKLALCF